MYSATISEDKNLGIQDLSFDELNWVGGADQATYDYGRAIGNSVRSGFQWCGRQISEGYTAALEWWES